MIATVDHPITGTLETLGIPVKLSDTPGNIRQPPPRLGEQTAAVLGELLGLSHDRIARLAGDGVIRIA
jgi:crotonobetainyl-CoA:carnitine CoA-transferase CaiB-like acyl-CoA transferase